MALEVVDEVCGILGAALSNIACVVNPEVIVIGGGVSKAGDISHRCSEASTLLPLHSTHAPTQSSYLRTRNDAGMYGCVEMLLD